MPTRTTNTLSQIFKEVYGKRIEEILRTKPIYGTKGYSLKPKVIKKRNHLPEWMR